MVPVRLTADLDFVWYVGNAGLAVGHECCIEFALNKTNDLKSTEERPFIIIEGPYHNLLHATTISRRTLPAGSMSDNVKFLWRLDLDSVYGYKFDIAFEKNNSLSKRKIEDYIENKNRASKLSGFRYHRKPSWLIRELCFEANMSNRSDSRVEDGQWSLTTQSTFADSGIGSEEIGLREKGLIYRAPQVGTDKWVD